MGEREEAGTSGPLLRAVLVLLPARQQVAGGVLGGSALLDAAVFGMTAVIDVLVAAGARPTSVEQAVAVGDVTRFLSPQTPLQVAWIGAARNEMPYADWSLRERPTDFA